MLKTLLTTLLFSLSLLFSTGVSAHPLIPYEVVEFMEQNPDATDQEIENFFLTNFGTIEEFYGIPPEEQDFTLKELYTPPEDYLEQVGGMGEAQSQSKIRENLALLLSIRENDRTFTENAQVFTFLGIQHILEGLDHILFVVALTLVLLPIRKLLILITTFTVAHSITLILAGAEIITFPQQIAEVFIAFSVAYMAFTSVFLKHINFFQKTHSKISLIFLFGLFHGLGFAGVFSDLSIPADKYLSSLLFFNVGVEIGQILILLVFVPFLWVLRKIHPSLYKWVSYIFAALITALAIFWFFIRL